MYQNLKKELYWKSWTEEHKATIDFTDYSHFTQ